MTQEQLADFESLTGTFLHQLGYLVSASPRHDFRSTRLRSTYLPWFAARHWLKSGTVLDRLSAIDRMDIADHPKIQI